MIKHFLNSKLALRTILFHIALGSFTAANSAVFIFYFFVVLAAEIPYITDGRSNVNIRLNNIIVYMVSFEILARMARTSPIIPYEMSKYILCSLFIYGIILQYRNGNLGWLLMALIIPAIFYDQTGAVNAEERIFNVLGSIDLTISPISSI